MLLYSRRLLTNSPEVRGEFVTSEAPWRSRTLATLCQFITCEIDSRAIRYEESLERGAFRFSAKLPDPPVDARTPDLGLAGVSL